MDFSGRSAASEMIAQLGDLATRVSLVEGMILGAEAAAAPDRFGVMRPKDSLLYASQVFQQGMYPALLNQIRGLMGGSLIQLPATVGELQTPESAADIERYVRWPHAGGRERVKLLKLLWDALGSEFGSRHLQYEMFYAGEPAAIQGREFRSFDWAAAEELVDRCLAGYDATAL
jgi:4-hydroxyphenylacetate 3-monooxygenase